MGLRHSGVGIATFVITLVGAALMLVVFVAAGMLELSTPGGVDEASPQAMIPGALLVGLILAQLVAAGLGIARRDRRRAFPVIGVSFAGMTLLATTALLIAGSTA